MEIILHAENIVPKNLVLQNPNILQITTMDLDNQSECQSEIPSFYSANSDEISSIDLGHKPLSFTVNMVNGSSIEVHKIWSTLFNMVKIIILYLMFVLGLLAKLYITLINSTL